MCSRCAWAGAVLAAALSLPGGRLAAAAPPPEAKVSLDVRDADAREIVAALVEVSGLQSVFDAGISCRLTLKVHALSWLRAFEATLAACGLGYEEEGSVVRIATREKLRAETAERRKLDELKGQARAGRLQLFRLSYARVRELAPLLEKALAPRGAVTYDERTNTLIVLD